jgi:3-isopropylmalate/(R)-2-methylmalate dehydratase large subunit
LAQTLTEKIIARAGGLSPVQPGQIVTVKVDLAMAHDSSGPRRWRPRLEELGVGLWDPEKIVIVSDHYVPAVDAASAQILRDVRKFVADYGVQHFYDMKGICHVILPEHGHLLPGMLLAGGDSHSPMAGAFGCYMAGFGATDMTGIVVTGETWLEVPQTIRVDWFGSFGQGVVAKDVMLFLCRELGMDNAGRVIEFGGQAVRDMSMEARMVLCNMTAELGADTGIIEPDDKTLAHIAAHGGRVHCPGDRTPPPPISPQNRSMQPSCRRKWPRHIRLPIARRSLNVAGSRSTKPISAPASARNSTIWRWRHVF